jgi:hypothetical protein
VDSRFVGNAHLLAYPLLAEALVFLVPETIFFKDVWMLVVAKEARTMFARVVFV